MTSSPTSIKYSAGIWTPARPPLRPRPPRWSRPHLGMRLGGIGAVVDRGAAADRSRRGARVPGLGWENEAALPSGPSAPLQASPRAPASRPRALLQHPPRPGWAGPRLLSPHRCSWRERNQERLVPVSCPVRPLRDPRSFSDQEIWPLAPASWVLGV